MKKAMKQSEIKLNIEKNKEQKQKKALKENAELLLNNLGKEPSEETLKKFSKNIRTTLDV